MKHFLILLLAISLGLLPKAAWAELDATTLSWNLPTQNTNGTPIPATGDESLASVTIEYSPCLSGGLSEPRNNRVISPPTTTTVIPMFVAGEWCFVSFVTNVASASSDFSNIVTKTVVDATPEPPILIVVDPLAYSIAKGNDTFLLAAVGTVPLGIECDQDQYVNGHNVVPVSEVAWFGTVRADVVVAKCE